MASQEWVKKDFYKVLGIDKNANSLDIKKSYRNLARKYHPDRNQNNSYAEQKFKDISEAYSILSNKENRKQYDAIKAMGSGARFTSASQSKNSQGEAGFEDIFGGIFKDVNQSNMNNEQEYYNSDFSKNFNNKLFGNENIIFKENFLNKEHSNNQTLKRSITATISFFKSLQGCLLRIKCKDTQNKVNIIKIPAGINNGQILKIKLKKRLDNSFLIKDLSKYNEDIEILINVKVKKHYLFKRNNVDLKVNIPITLSEAILGKYIKIPTISGKLINVKIPPLTSSNVVLKIKNLGIGSYYYYNKIYNPFSNNFGNYFINLYIVLPGNVNKSLREKMENFANFIDSEVQQENPRIELIKKL